METKNQIHKQITEETAEKLLTLMQSAPRMTAEKSMEIAKKPVFHLRRSQVAAGITGAVGLIIFTLGIENLIAQIPAMKSPPAEIGLGIFLLAISGLFLKKLI